MIENDNIETGSIYDQVQEFLRDQFTQLSSIQDSIGLLDAARIDQQTLISNLSDELASLSGTPLPGLGWHELFDKRLAIIENLHAQQSVALERAMSQMQVCVQKLGSINLSDLLIRIERLEQSHRHANGTVHAI